MSGKQWTIFGILIAISFGLAGLGFAAMSTNPPFTVSTWVPKAFFIAAGIIFVVAIIFLIYSVRKNKNQKNQNISDSMRQSVREYRQELNSKKQILDKLLALDTYLGEQVKKQDFSGEDFLNINSKHWLNWYDYYRLILLAIAYLIPIFRSVFTKMMVNTILDISTKFNIALKELNLGTLLIVENDEAYKNMYKEILQLEDGLPIYITAKTNRFILISISLNGLRIMSREKSFWNELRPTNRVSGKYLEFGKNYMSLMLMPLDNSLIALRSEIAQDIEKYFTVAGDL